MKKSSAERQRAYRQRHLKDEHGSAERLNTVIDVHAKRALERLAQCYGVTQRQVLERTLIAAERNALERAQRWPKGAAQYYDGRLRLDWQANMTSEATGKR